MARESLAVKYRPKSFDDLTEQEAIKVILEEQIKTKTFQHAYLFTGPAGTGKTTSARIFANMINDGKGNPIEVDAASNSGVDNIRRIIDDSKKKALDAEYKIFIIDECHSLSSGAWQAMLKLLEEPPKFSIFILCTTNPERIPRTILSRVQRYQFNKISNEGIENRLHQICVEEELAPIPSGTYDEAISYIAKVASGGMRDAITTMDKCLSYSKKLTLENVLKVLGTEDYNTFFDLAICICTADRHWIEIIENVYAEGKDLKQFVKQFIKFLVDWKKYIIFKNFDYVEIPPTEENKKRLDAMNITKMPEDGMMIDNLLDLMLIIDNEIKFESDVKNAIESRIIIELGFRSKTSVNQEN